MEEFFHFRVHGSTADNDFFETAAQSIYQFLPDLPIDLSVEQRNAERPFHSLFIYDRLNDILIDFLDNEWHGNNQAGFYLFEGLHQNLWRGDFAQKCDVSTHGSSCKKVESATVGVSQG